MDKLPTNVWHVYWFFVKKQPLGFFMLALAAVIANLSSSILWPYTAGKLIDTFAALDLYKENVLPTIVSSAMWTIGILVLIEGSQRLKGFMLAYVIPRFQANIRMALFHVISRHSYTFFTQKHVGSIAHRINDLPKSAHIILDNICVVFLPLIISILVLASTFLIFHPALSWLFLCWVLTYSIVCKMFAVKASEYASQQQAVRATLQGKVVDSIANHLIVKAFTGHKHEIDTIAAVQEEEVARYRFSLLYMEKFKVLLSIVSLSGAASLFCTSIFLWSAGIMSVGDVVFISNTIVNLMTNLWFASDEISYSVYELGVGKQSLMVVQDSTSDIKRENVNEVSITEGNIEFANVTFGYDGARNVLHNLSFKIHSGERVGLVGFSGSGKTTVVHLIMRLYEVTNGVITIDGHDISGLSPETIRRHISFIPQDPMLFHRTVAENILYGDPNATLDMVIEAAKKAKCHEFITQLEHGYDTMVGERGAKLSSGQKQRIAMARAVLKNSVIIIMDEATSALDSVTEKLIEQSIADVIKERTSILVAHRLSTLLHMDRIFVFDQGRIVEIGSHTELLARNGYYARLWSMQQVDSIHHKFF